MYKFLLKIIKKIIIFLVFFQQKKTFTISIIFLSITIVSWNYLNNKENSQLKITEIIYQKIESTINNIQEIVFRKNNIDYVLDMMELSKALLEVNKIDEAIEKIMHALESTTDTNIKSMLNIRIARMYLQTNQSDLAIQYLEKINRETWLPVKYHLIGEVMLINGDIQKAKQAWKKSIEYDKYNNMREIMLAKINNLQE